MALDSSNWNLVLQALRSQGDARAAKASAFSGGIQNMMSGVNGAIDMYADKQRRDAEQARRDAELADQRAYAEKMMLEGRQYDEGQTQQAFTRQLVARDIERSAQEELAKQARDRAAAEEARKSAAVSQLISPMTGMRPAFGEKPTFSAMGLPIAVESRAPTEQEMARRFRPSMPVDALSTARPFASPEPKPVNPMDAMMDRAKLSKLLEEIKASEAKRTAPTEPVETQEDKLKRIEAEAAARSRGAALGAPRSPTGVTATSMLEHELYPIKQDIASAVTRLREAQALADQGLLSGQESVKTITAELEALRTRYADKLREAGSSELRQKIGDILKGWQQEDGQ